MTIGMIFGFWGVLLTLFLCSNKRWQDRMARIDADQAKACETISKR